MQKNDLHGMTSAMYNVFESVVLPVHDVAKALKQDMLTGGAVGALMSGSGPSIVGVFDREDRAIQVCDRIRQKGIAAFVCKPVN